MAPEMQKNGYDEDFSLATAAADTEGADKDAASKDKKATKIPHVRIDAEGITGVVFLSGDRHFSELSRMVLPNGNELHDLTLSPMTSQAYTPREENHLSVPGSRVSERNFGRLAFTGPRNERRLTISVHATDGTSIWEDSIPAPPRK